MPLRPRSRPPNPLSRLPSPLRRRWKPKRPAPILLRQRKGRISRGLRAQGPRRGIRMKGSTEMRRDLPLGVLVAVSLLLGGFPFPGAAQSWRSVTMSRQVAGEKALDVRIRFSAGRLAIQAGETGTLYRMQLRYDEENFEPVAKYERGRLDLGVEGTKNSLRWRKEDTQQMDLSLARGVPMALDL
ncbi:MAG: hypothetical protein E4G90_03890, partial [Gemmatimonadales bacterium]